MLILDVSVPSLKRLTLDLSIHEENLYYEADFKYKIMVNAPNLEYLGFCDFASDYIYVGGLPSVAEARVNVHKFFEDWDWRKQGNYANCASRLLRSISNVWRLALTGYALRCLSYSGPNLATCCNVVYLELCIDPSNGPVLLPDLLQSSPKLEVLVFPEGLTVIGECEYDVNGDILFDYCWSPPERVPECLLLSLMKFKIHKFCGDEEEELNLVKYLLKNGMVLEEVMIWCHCLFGGDNSFSFKDELENYPRGSTNCNFRHGHGGRLRPNRGLKFRGSALCIKHAARAMVKRQHGLVGLVRAAASEFGKHGIRVNCVSPYFVATPLVMPGMSAAGIEDPSAAEALASSAGNLKGIALKANHVAEDALFLASDESVFVSGHNLAIDGGFTVVDNSIATLMQNAYKTVM
ncbi:hypothetical protein RHSIM_Rhsim06G0213500 [Rhododendron simsii]|uniref:FBD domain-containing protein n=1 Tax=Rhododendron simsii TaxID=118357 RepID=A0A834LNK8_RHOSS|nr:hypothetical protein RHSIM_Rhsim06G0213500 [Rhododendron simsii]